MVKQIAANGKNTLNGSIHPGVIVKAILVSYIITIPLFIIFSFILAYTDFPEKYIAPAVVITSIVSILVAGSTVTRNAKSKGWLHGGMVGLIYILILYLLSSVVFNSFQIDKYVITMVVIGVLTGSIGGILGINIKSSSHAKVKRRKL